MDYEIRFIDWSSDVCSSELSAEEFEAAVKKTKGSWNVFGADGSTSAIADDINRLEAARSKEPATVTVLDKPYWGAGLVGVGLLLVLGAAIRRSSCHPPACSRSRRSEERRHGKEWVNKGNSR